jgi:RNA polymerase primary sigma factor
MAREKAVTTKAAKAKAAADLLAQVGNATGTGRRRDAQDSSEDADQARQGARFLTYAEINDHLPDDVVDAEQIESIISTFNDMGIQVYDEAPDAETLLMSDAAPASGADDADVEEQAEQALSTVDSEFGRTTDPVRMYMREMGSVELLTREGEIEIAKRIEDGLKHMIQAISACPTTIAEILNCADKIARDEMRIEELIDGLIDPKKKALRKIR